MPRHATGLGGGSFPVANKILSRYEQDRQYRIHQQKLASMKCTIDVHPPKKRNHLLLRLKQIQKEEERQAEIDHENKLLLNKMTHTMKYGGRIDNWNNYESRSLNYPQRERENEDIARENLGIARRLENIRPKISLDTMERDYQKHVYLSHLWSTSVKDFGDYTPRRSRLSRSRSLGSSINETDTYDDDFESDSGDRKKLPKLDDRRRRKSKDRGAKSESGMPVRKREDREQVQGTRLPRIQQKHRWMHWEPIGAVNLDKDESAPVSQKPQEETSDVAQLFRIAKQLGRPEDIFIKSLVKKSHKHRISLKAKFRQKYDLDLISELKEGLGSEWEHLINAVLQERDVAAAYAVFDALSKQEGQETSDMSDVVEILAAKDNAAMAELKEAYRKEFSISLEEDLTDRSTPPIQTLLVMLQKGTRDEAAGEVDNQEAFNDALALHESGEGRWTSASGRFLRLVSERSIPHVQAVLTEYKSASGGTDVLAGMKDECPHEYYLTAQTLINCMRSPQTYYAELLHKHKQPTDPMFVSLLVTRSEIDMPQIRKAFKSKYSTDLVDHIRSKPHPTMRCLIEFANKVPPGSKVKDTKKLKGGVVQTHPQQKGGQQQTGPQQHVAATRNPAIKPIKSKVDSLAVDPESPLRKTESFKTKSQKQTGPQQRKSKGEKGAGDAAKAKVMEREYSMDDGNHNGTVNPVSPFRPDDDVQKLNSAMSGLGTDEAVIISIIPKRSNRQRRVLKQKYEQKFKKNLMIDLESELTGDMEEIVLALMMTLSEYDAYCLHEAVEGLGTSEATLIGILCTRSAKEIGRIKECYQKAYKTDMEQDISRDCSGPFRDLIMALMKGERESGTHVNMEEAQDNAKLLYKDGEIAIDPCTETFRVILTQKNHMQVKATFEEYKRLTGHDVYTAIRKFMMGDDEEGYIGLAKAIEDPLQFYAERLNSCFTHIGVNDNMLIRIVVARSEVDLVDIKARYVELYSKSLPEMVNRECKGDYKRMLLAVLDNEEEIVRHAHSPSKKQSKKGKSGTNIGAS